MINILIFGSGRVGLLTGAILASSKDYHIHIADVQADRKQLHLGENAHNLKHCILDINNTENVKSYVQEHDIHALTAALPYFLTKKVAEIAKVCNTHYFDLTEDVETTKYVETLAKNTDKVFAPQCGLAPGFISVVTNDLVKQFDEAETVKMRVGALPVNISHPLQYALTWSTEGLINEYVKPCEAIRDYKNVTIEPLDDLETIKIDGLTYEAFNTSGGIGSLKDTYKAKVRNINYKSVRYPGHCEKLRFLINDLKLRDKQELLCEIFNNSIPRVEDDVVLVYVSVEGKINGVYHERHFAKKYHSQEAFGQKWSALQLTTACGICVTIDLAIKHKYFAPGFAKQEDINLTQMMDNRFGHYYRYNFLDGIKSPKLITKSTANNKLEVI
ncbi:saccharopine dehydrogenase family protein [Fastidiosibacter lacustris]|uniref:saccharopine dehydrogenase family protein n=1 Tax=Fastidiosibacter lacustris TaxID=2056695 RepID=UPI000E353506|nr:saccharopine dehydrogenase C-terminal domain-containing protein [Fastidiosibacter lacustris]